jgi:hypothetical protein
VCVILSFCVCVSLQKFVISPLKSASLNYCLKCTHFLARVLSEYWPVWPPSFPPRTGDKRYPAWFQPSISGKPGGIFYDTRTHLFWSTFQERALSHVKFLYTIFQRRRFACYFSQTHCSAALLSAAQPLVLALSSLGRPKRGSLT